MSDYYIKNFDPAIYSGEDGVISFDFDSNQWLRIKGSNWVNWLNGREDKVPKILASRLWFIFTGALMHYSDNQSLLTFDLSVSEDVAVKKYIQVLRLTLTEDFQIVKHYIESSDKINKVWYLNSPYEIEETLDGEYTSLMAAYTIMQMDEGITGLLEGDAIKAATCVHHATTGLQCIENEMEYEARKDHEKNIKSKIGVENARKRHIETYALKKEAIDYWRENLDIHLSNEKAAEELKKIVPLSHRTLAQYVGEAKKENIHPASKV